MEFYAQLHTFDQGNRYWNRKAILHILQKTVSGDILRICLPVVILSFEYIGIFIEFYAHIWSRKPILVKDSYRIRISWTTSVNYDDDNYDDDDYVDGSRFWKLLLKLDSSFGCLTLAKLFSWILCLLSTFVFCLRLFLQRISCWNLCSSHPGFCVLS